MVAAHWDDVRMRRRRLCEALFLLLNHHHHLDLLVVLIQEVEAFEIRMKLP